MTHYLLIHALANDKELGLKNRLYLTRYHRGDDPVKAFEEVFETSLSDFDKLISAYARQRRINVLNWPRPDEGLQLTRTVLGETEKNYLIANLQFSMGREELALSYLEELDGEEEYSGEALSLRALLLNHDASNAEIAAQLAQQAAQMAPESAAVFGNLAHYEMDSAQNLAAEGLHAEARLRVERAEVYARKGIQINPQEFNALRYLASMMLAEGRHDEALEILDQALNVIPSDYSVRMDIIKILLLRGDIEGAVPMVKSLIGAAHALELNEKFIELLAQMETGKVDPALLDQL